MKYLLAFAFLGLLTLSPSPSCGAQPPLYFSGQLKTNDGVILVSCQIDPRRFLLTSATAEFRAICLRIDNFSKERFTLRPGDRLLAASAEGVQAVCSFDVSRSLGWQQLSLGARQRMAYPRFVDTMEQEMVFAFAPKTTLAFVPVKLTLIFDTSPPTTCDLALAVETSD